MSLKQIVARLESTSIDNLEEIARGIRAEDQQEYADLFAQTIVQQKIERSGIPYQEGFGGFPYVLQGDQNILVRLSAGLIIPDTRKSSLEVYAKRVNGQMERSPDRYSGLIHFLPFLINGKAVRAVLEREMNVTFINLPYDERSLERRFRQYGRG